MTAKKETALKKIDVALPERNDNDAAQGWTDNRAGIHGNRRHTECTRQIFWRDNVWNHCLAGRIIECHCGSLDSCQQVDVPMVI